MSALLFVFLAMLLVLAMILTIVLTVSLSCYYYDWSDSFTKHL